MHNKPQQGTKHYYITLTELRTPFSFPFSWGGGSPRSLFVHVCSRGAAREAGAAVGGGDQDAVREGKGHFHAATHPLGT